MRVVLRAEANEDLLITTEFYEGQGEGLGNYFLSCLKADLDALKSQAGIHEIYCGFHRKLMRKFPFAIFYRVDGDVVDVVAILDCRRNPGATDDRLGETL